MKTKLYSLLVIIITLVALTFTGCGSSRPSVLEQKDGYHGIPSFFCYLLRRDDEKVKADLEGKVVEVYGELSPLDTSDKNLVFKYKTSQDGPWVYVCATLTKNGQKVFEKYRDGDEVCVRGYASVKSSRSQVLLHLQEAEIIRITKYGGYRVPPIVESFESDRSKLYDPKWRY